MKILDLYIAKKFLLTLFFILLMASVITIIFDVSEKIDDFLENDVTLKEIVFDYYLNFVPTILNLISPLIIFISALYFTSRLANNAEVIAVLSSGTSYYRLLMPYIAVAVLLAGVDMYLKNFVVPKAFKHQLSFELKYVQESYYYDARNIHKQLDDNTFFYAQSIDYNQNAAYRFSIETYKDQHLASKMVATQAYMDTVNNTWKIKNYIVRKIDGLKESLEFGDSLTLKLPITKKDFSQKVKSVPSMTTPELSRFINEERFKGESLINFYLVEKYKRFSLPFAIIVLVLIAVTIATRKVRGGIGTHLLIGILIAISYELSMRFTSVFSTNANFPPMLAVWIPNIVYGAFALLILKKTPK